MAIKLSTTQQEKMSGVKVLVYGEAGIGKTTLCKTAPDPIIINAEAGLLSLCDVDIPVININTFDDMSDAFLFLTTSEEGKKFKTICLDSITDIAEVLLHDLRGVSKDGRMIYGDLAVKMAGAIRSFRDMPGANIYFTAKSKRTENGDRIPHMPGAQLVTNLPYWFDLVLPMRMGETEDGTKYRYLQTQSDLYYLAKDRSGKLDMVEEPDLTKLFNKVLS
jgi:hypothetical protein